MSIHLMWKVRLDRLARFQHDLLVFFSELKKEEEIKTTYWVDLLIHLRSWRMEQNVFTWEIFEKHTFNHSYGANPTVNIQINLVILEGLRILPFTLLNESHWFRVYKNFYLTGLELFVFLFLKANFKKQYGYCKQDFN